MSTQRPTPIVLCFLLLACLFLAPAVNADTPFPTHNVVLQSYSVEVNGNEIAEDLAEEFVQGFNTDSSNVHGTNNVQLIGMLVALDDVNNEQGEGGRRHLRRTLQEEDVATQAQTRTGQAVVVGIINAQIDLTDAVQAYLASRRDTAKFVSITSMSSPQAHVDLLDLANAKLLVAELENRVTRGNAKLSAVAAAVAETERSLTWSKEELRRLLQTSAADELSIQSLRVEMDGLTAQLQMYRSEDGMLQDVLSSRLSQLRTANRSVRKASRQINQVLKGKRQSDGMGDLVSLVDTAESKARSKNSSDNLSSDAV